MVHANSFFFSMQKQYAVVSLQLNSSEQQKQKYSVMSILTWPGPQTSWNPHPVNYLWHGPYAEPRPYHTRTKCSITYVPEGYRRPPSEVPFISFPSGQNCFSAIRGLCTIKGGWYLCLCRLELSPLVVLNSKRSEDKLQSIKGSGDSVNFFSLLICFLLAVGSTN